MKSQFSYLQKKEKKILCNTTMLVFSQVVGVDCSVEQLINYKIYLLTQRSVHRIYNMFVVCTVVLRTL